MFFLFSFVALVLSRRSVAFRSAALPACRCRNGCSYDDLRHCHGCDLRRCGLGQFDLAITLPMHDLRAGLHSILFLQLSRRPAMRMLPHFRSAADDNLRHERLIDDDGSRA